MNRRRVRGGNLLRSTSLICTLLAAWGGILNVVKAKEKNVADHDAPNVVVMMVDDMGFSDLGCYGGEIKTPRLDSLASNGLRFRNFYNTAKCSETRATLLSGLYHPEVGIMKLDHCWTLADAMHEGGYKTMMAGKWHLNGQPTERGFERYFGHLSGATDFFVGDNSFRLNGEQFNVPKKGFYTTDANVDYAIEFISEAQKTDSPFFCYVAFNAPHYPLQAPKDEVDKYRGKYMIGWDELRKQRFARQQKLGILGDKAVLSPRPKGTPAWDSLDDKTKDLEDLRMATYAAMIDRVDQNIGRLIDHLKESGDFENTLILFFSDNGACPFDRNKHIDKQPWEAGSHWTYDTGWAHACNTPFREFKQKQHEGGISSPCIAHWPAGLKTKTGGVTPEVGHLVDIMPTLMELSGVEYPETYAGRSLKPLRGRSMLPIFRKEKPAPRGKLFFDFAGSNHALRDGDLKIVARNSGKWELYDIVRDRSELNNLISERADDAKRLIAEWDAWAKEAGVRLKKRKPKPKSE